MRYVVLLESDDYNIVLGIYKTFGEATEKVFKYLEEHQYKNGRYDNVRFAYGLECNETGCMVTYTLYGDHVSKSGITESIYILESEEESNNE